jgi:DNA replication protein DnaC
MFGTGRRWLKSINKVNFIANGKRSNIIASQVPFKNWYDVIAEQTVADAILDRLVNQSIRVELLGESLRKLKTTTII